MFALGLFSNGGVVSISVMPSKMYRNTIHCVGTWLKFICIHAGLCKTRKFLTFSVVVEEERKKCYGRGGKKKKNVKFRMWVGGYNWSWNQIIKLYMLLYFLFLFIYFYFSNTYIALFISNAVMLRWSVVSMVANIERKGGNQRRKFLSSLIQYSCFIVTFNLS